MSSLLLWWELIISRLRPGMKTGWRGVNDRPAPRWTVLKLQKNSKFILPFFFFLRVRYDFMFCVPLSVSHTSIFQTRQSRGGAVMVTEFRVDAALAGGPGGLPGVPALRVQRGQPAFLVGLRRSEKGDELHRGGWESQDHIRRLRVHIVTQRGTSSSCVHPVKKEAFRLLLKDGLCDQT